MVFTVNLKWLSFKQDISNLESMLSDQASTYVVLRYATDIPQIAYTSVMEILSTFISEITHKKLLKLVKQYMAVAGIGMKMDDEYDSTIEIPVKHTGFQDEDDEDLIVTL